jgi:hypothetical protein
MKGDERKYFEMGLLPIEKYFKLIIVSRKKGKSLLGFFLLIFQIN